MMYNIHVTTLVDDSSEHTSESSVDGFGLSELLVLVPQVFFGQYM